MTARVQLAADLSPPADLSAIRLHDVKLFTDVIVTTTALLRLYVGLYATQTDTVTRTVFEKLVVHSLHQALSRRHHGLYTLYQRPEPSSVSLAVSVCNSARVPGLVLTDCTVLNRTTVFKRTHLHYIHLTAFCSHADSRIITL